jgi:para-aminobenzoate synthetase component 1
LETTSIKISNPAAFKVKALEWANRFKLFVAYDSSDYAQDHYHKYDWLLVVDSVDFIQPLHNFFEEVEIFHQKNKGSIYGWLNYDCQTETHGITHTQPSTIQFPNCYFFSPRYILSMEENTLTVNRNYPETFEIVEQIEKTELTKAVLNPMVFKPKTSREKYLSNIERIKQKIENGDFYELNYCTEIIAEDVTINPIDTFLSLNHKSKAPFSTLLKWQNNFALCASPERFICKRKNKIISQPIKGTISRGKDIEEDESLKSILQNSSKERAENVMIVDLVRHDLTPYAKTSSINVDELCGIYTFNSLHQMISTVSAELADAKDGIKAIKAAFPMGSMTGAPKHEVLKNIMELETSARGLFSGTIGYTDRDGDFDFNIVIRTIFYSEDKKTISIKTGGAITYDSIPEKEYEEVLLKRKILLEVLGGVVDENN